jgi:hypothetical protein
MVQTVRTVGRGWKFSEVEVDRWIDGGDPLALHRLASGTGGK